jgi:hypothetical protein
MVITSLGGSSGIAAGTRPCMGSEKEGDCDPGEETGQPLSFLGGTELALEI